MKPAALLVALGFALLTLAPAPTPRAPATAPAKPLRLVIVGDSTVCDYPADNPCRGWGQFIQGYFKDNVKVINLAQSGRSTKTFINGGLWKKTRWRRSRNVVLIQFGHNDSHGPGHGESTDAATDYKEFLRRYVDESARPGRRRCW